MTLLRPSSIHPFHKVEERHFMKPSTEDEATGRLHDVKGTIKETIGGVIDNPDLEADGQAEKNVGRVQNLIGKVETLVGE